MRWFFDHFPEGSLQAHVLVGPEAGQPFVVVQAFAHRHEGDHYPGQGLAYEPFPGTTPYTKGSELMNAETSAWGRALAAIGAPTKGHVASADEVRGAETRRGQAVPSTTDQPEQQLEPQAEPLPEDHEHEWMQSPKLRKFVVCKDPRCRKVLSKEDAGVQD